MKIVYCDKIGQMKKLGFLLVLPMTVFAQSNPSCGKVSLLMSRELNREPITVQRSMTLAGLHNSWSASRNSGVQPAGIDVTFIRPANIHFPIDQNPQDGNGRDLFLGVVTDLLVKHLVYDRAR